MAVPRDGPWGVALARGLWEPGILVFDVQPLRRQDARVGLRTPAGELRVEANPLNYSLHS